MDLKTQMQLGTMILNESAMKMRLLDILNESTLPEIVPEKDLTDEQRIWVRDRVTDRDYEVYSTHSKEFDPATFLSLSLSERKSLLKCAILVDIDVGFTTPSFVDSIRYLKYAQTLIDLLIEHYDDEDVDEKDIANPDHYNIGRIECKKWIQDFMSEPAFYLAWLCGSALKYLYRFEDKGHPVRDLRKAKTFIGFVFETVS